MPLLIFYLGIKKFSKLVDNYFISLSNFLNILRLTLYLKSFVVIQIQTVQKCIEWKISPPSISTSSYFPYPEQSVCNFLFILPAWSTYIVHISFIFFFLIASCSLDFLIKVYIGEFFLSACLAIFICFKASIEFYLWLYYNLFHQFLIGGYLGSQFCCFRPCYWE